MIVTIDGPAGAGKSSVARALAARLGFRFLDTGAMYRAVALAGGQAGIDLEDQAALADLARRSTIDVNEQRVLLDGQDVSHAIRTFDVTSKTRFAANNPAVRAHLVSLQRRIAADGDFVTEGRDQGSVVFPHAQCKIFLTASPEERARRRWRELTSRGESVSLDEVLAKQIARDASDAGRNIGPLLQAADAVEIVTDGLSPDEVIDRLERLVRSRMRQG